MREALQKLSNVANNIVVECTNIKKEFYLHFQRRTSLRETFLHLLKGHSHQPQPIFSLEGFNLKIYKGERVALVGTNGSGKSTVLRLIAGIYKPLVGTVKTVGRVGAVIELGAGFHRELTGAANIELYSAILGLSRKERYYRFGEIVEFSELQDFIRMPVKYYSPGMVARLAFSVAIFSEPDILLLDEVLAVGDHSFKKKCRDRLDTFRNSGKTLVVTGHDPRGLSELCTRAVWLDRGSVRMEGQLEEVMKAYYQEEN